MAYLCHHYEPDNNTELLRLQQGAKAYQAIGDEIYKVLVIGPLLNCMSTDEGKELLVETHSGICRCHRGSLALIAKVFRQGFYWPSIIDDASKVVTTCKVMRTSTTTPVRLHQQHLVQRHQMHLLLRRQLLPHLGQSLGPMQEI
jgi:hypothetical protein